MKEKREFNFAQRWVETLAKENESPSQLKPKVLTWGIAGLLFLGLVGSIPWLWEAKVQRDVTLIEGKISSLGGVSNQVKQLKALKAEAEGQEKLLNTIQNSTLDPGPILDKLKNTLPAGTVVNTLSLQENTLVLSINVPLPVDAARLWISLRDSGMFQGVDIQTVSLQDKVQTLNLNLTLK